MNVDSEPLMKQTAKRYSIVRHRLAPFDPAERPLAKFSFPENVEYLAATLKWASASIGLEVTEGASHNAIARLFGYPSWAALDRSRGPVATQSTRLGEAALEAVYLPRLQSVMRLDRLDARAVYEDIRCQLIEALASYVEDEVLEAARSSKNYVSVPQDIQRVGETTDADDADDADDEWRNIVRPRLGWPDEGEPGFPVKLFSDTLPRRMVRTLKKAARTQGLNVALAQCYNVIARLYGYPHWAALLANIEGDIEEAYPADMIGEPTLVQKIYLPRLAAIFYMDEAQVAPLYESIEKRAFSIHQPLPGAELQAPSPIRPPDQSSASESRASLREPVVIVKKSRLPRVVSGKRIIDLR